MKRDKTLYTGKWVIVILAMTIMASACGQNLCNPLGVARYGDGATSYTLITNGYATVGMEWDSQIIFLNDDTKTALWIYEADGLGGMEFAHSSEILGDELLISDTRNDRVIIAEAMNGSFSENPGFQVVWNSETDGNFTLDYPNDANFLDNGNILVTDRDNHRIIEVNRDTGDIEWQFGVTAIPGSDASHLDGPHNADRLANGNTIIADSNNDRIVEVDPRGGLLWEYDPGIGNSLSWPRDADVLDNGNVLITDSRNGRILEVTREGEKVWEHWVNIVGTRTEPYEADRLENGNVLISCPGLSTTGVVFVVDYYTQKILWSYSGDEG